MTEWKIIGCTHKPMPPTGRQTEWQILTGDEWMCPYGVKLCIFSLLWEHGFISRMTFVLMSLQALNYTTWIMFYLQVDSMRHRPQDFGKEGAAFEVVSVSVARARRRSSIRVEGNADIDFFFCRTVAFQACLKCRHSIKPNAINQLLMTIEHQCQSEHVFSWMRIYTPDANKGDDKEVNLRFMNEVLKCWSSKMNIKDEHDLSTACSEMTEGHLSKCKHIFTFTLYIQKNMHRKQNHDFLPSKESKMFQILKKTNHICVKRKHIQTQS